MMSRETQKPCRVKSSKYCLLHKYKTKLRIHEIFAHKRLDLALFIVIYITDDISPLCPAKYPELQRYENIPNHGSVCRSNDEKNWVCPKGCYKLLNAPFCKMKRTNIVCKVL